MARILLKRHLILVALLVGEVLLFNTISRVPLVSVSDFVAIVTQSAPVLFLAFGMTLVLMTAGIDLSVGSMVALIACAMASFGGEDADSTFWITAVPCGLLFAIVLGSLNGLLIARFDMPPIIATLGTMIFFRGWSFVLLGDRERAPFGDVPGYDLLGEFFFVAIGLVCVYVVGGIFFARSRWRQEILLIGGNRIAGRYAGIRVGRRLWEVYTLVGGLAFLAALAFTSRNSSVNASALTGLELKVIVAVVLGGTRVQGGSGSLVGSFLGVLIIAVLEEGLRGSALWGHEYLPFKIRHLEEVLLGLLLVTGVWLHSREREAMP